MYGRTWSGSVFILPRAPPLATENAKRAGAAQPFGAALAAGVTRSACVWRNGRRDGLGIRWESHRVSGARVGSTPITHKIAFQSTPRRMTDMKSVVKPKPAGNGKSTKYRRYFTHWRTGKIYDA